MTRSVLACVTAVGLASAAPTLAQERLVTFVADAASRSQSLLELDATVSGFGRVRGLTPIPAVPGSVGASAPVVISGSRYLMWLNWQRSGADARWLQMLDRRTGQTTLLGATFVNRLEADPVRPRVFFAGAPVLGGGSTHAVAMFDFETQALREYLPNTGFMGPFVNGFTYAPGTDRLLAWRTAAASLGGGFGFYDVAVVDVDSGAIVRSFPLPAEPWVVAARHDGRRLYVVDGMVSLGVPAPIVAYDPETGAEVARTAPLLPAQLTIDESRGWLLATLPATPAIAVFDADTLAPLGTVTVGPAPWSLGVLPGRWMTGAYVFRSGFVGSQCASTIETLNPSGTVSRRVDLSSLGGLVPPCHASSLVLLRSPFAPTKASASVVGQQVTISWDNPGNTSSFEVQVGFAPGATTLRVPVAGSATSIAGVVPPGTYYLRIKAVNEIGASPASQELRVDVR